MKRVSIEKMLYNSVPENLPEGAERFCPGLSEETEERIINKGIEKLRNTDDNGYIHGKIISAPVHKFRFVPAVAAVCVIAGAAVISAVINSRITPDDNYSDAVLPSDTTAEVTEYEETPQEEYHDWLAEKPGKFINENHEYEIENTGLETMDSVISVSENKVLYNSSTIKSGEFCKLNIYNMEDLSCDSPEITAEWDYEYGCPHDLTVSPSGEVYVLGTASNKDDSYHFERRCILKYSSEGQIIKESPVSGVWHGKNIFTDNIVLSCDGNKITEFGMGGTVNVYDSDLNLLISTDISEKISSVCNLYSDVKGEDYAIINIVNDAEGNNLVLVQNLNYVDEDDEFSDLSCEYSLLFFDSSFESAWKHISFSTDISWMDIKEFSDGSLGCLVDYGYDYNNDSRLWVIGRIDTENGNITELLRTDNCNFNTSGDYILNYGNYYELWNVGSSSPIFKSKEYNEDFENNFYDNAHDSFYYNNYAYTVEEGEGGPYTQAVEYNGTESNVISEYKYGYPGKYFYTSEGNLRNVAPDGVFEMESGQWKEILKFEPGQEVFSDAFSDGIVCNSDPLEIYSAEGEKITEFKLPDIFQDAWIQIITERHTARGESLYFYGNQKVWRYDSWDESLHEIDVINNNISFWSDKREEYIEFNVTGGIYDFYITDADANLYGYDIEENTLTLIISDMSECWLSSVSAVSSNLLYGTHYDENNSSHSLYRFKGKT